MKLPQQEIQKIAVFRALQLGDMLCAIPAIRALRAAYPNAHLTLLGLPWAKSLLVRFPQYFDAFIHFPGYPGLPEQNFDAQSFPFFLQQMISERFDVIFQMQGNGSIVNPMIELFGAKHTAGFCLKDDYCPNRTHYLEYPDGYHEVERHLKLMEFLGIDSRGTDLEFPILQEDYAELRAKGLDLPPGRYVCVHAGSRGGYRQWPPEYFAALADHCAGQELQVVLTGTSDELPIIEKVIRHMEHEPVIAAGKTSLGAVAALIGNAFGLISNCTGVSHIAAALKTPSVVISMDGEPNRWAPMNKTIHYTVDWTKTPEFNLALDELKKLFLLRPKGEHFRDRGVTTRENLMQSP